MGTIMFSVVTALAGYVATEIFSDLARRIQKFRDARNEASRKQMLDWLEQASKKVNKGDETV